MAWRTKVGGAQPTEHASREAADAYLDELRARYRTGATRVGLVRLYDPDGGVRLVDFSAELKVSSRALRDVERSTAAKDRTITDAVERWEATIRRAVALGQALDDVATAAGCTARDVRAILRHG